MQTILIVDDNATERDLIGKVVTTAGHLPEYACDGEECLTKARGVNPALILLDVVMPKLDGFATCRKLKKDPATANIPVVLVTSKGQASDRLWGERQGAVGHICKPFTPQQMTEAIQQFIA